MQTTAHFYDCNNKPPPPPEAPTLEQRAKAVQFAARNHKGNYSPKTEKHGLGHRAHQAVKMILPSKASPKPSGKIPKTIVISAMPEIHYENNFDRKRHVQDEEDDGGSFSSYDDSFCSYTLAYEETVFRNSDDAVETEEEFAAYGAVGITPVIERQRAFNLSRSMESGDDLEVLVFSPPETEPKSPRPRFMQGLKRFLSPKKTTGVEI